MICMKCIEILYTINLYGGSLCYRSQLHELVMKVSYLILDKRSRYCFRSFEISKTSKGLLSVIRVCNELQPNELKGQQLQTRSKYVTTIVEDGLVDACDEAVRIEQVFLAYFLAPFVSCNIIPRSVRYYVKQSMRQLCQCR